jgi:hypothetical protein
MSGLRPDSSNIPAEMPLSKPSLNLLPSADIHSTHSVLGKTSPKTSSNLQGFFKASHQCVPGSTRTRSTAIRQPTSGKRLAALAAAPPLGYLPGLMPGSGLGLPKGSPNSRFRGHLRRPQQHLDARKRWRCRQIARLIIRQTQVRILPGLLESPGSRLFCSTSRDSEALGGLVRWMRRTIAAVATPRARSVPTLV